MTSSNKVYTIQDGDTLSEIAQRHGTTTEQLSRINGIKDPNKLQIGRKIALNPKPVCKVTVQLLDRDHNPLANARIRMDYGGKRKELSSGGNGRVPTIATGLPEQLVRIFIARADGTWKEITAVYTDWGSKLVTLISPKIKLTGKTMPDSGVEGELEASPQTEAKPVKLPEIPKTTVAKGTLQANFGDGKGLKTIQTTTKNGLPIVAVTNDQVNLEFLKGYTGEKLTEDDYKEAAKGLQCEVEVIKAIAEQESKSSAFDSNNRPTILYERHWFSRLTKRKYDKENPDISSRKPYTFRTKDEKSMPIPEDDRYGLPGSHQYRRLAKAYVLDKRSALQACSWGKFQIMGFNYQTCGYPTIEAFVAMMCESEKSQLDAACNFIKANCCNAVRNKNWKKIAKAYNGENYKQNQYDEALEGIYNRLVAKRVKK